MSEGGTNCRMNDRRISRTPLPYSQIEFRSNQTNKKQDTCSEGASTIDGQRNCNPGDSRGLFYCCSLFRYKTCDRCNYKRQGTRARRSSAATTDDDVGKRAVSANDTHASASYIAQTKPSYVINLVSRLLAIIVGIEPGKHFG